MKNGNMLLKLDASNLDSNFRLIVFFHAPGEMVLFGSIGWYTNELSSTLLSSEQRIVKFKARQRMYKLKSKTPELVCTDDTTLEDFSTCVLEKAMLEITIKKNETLCFFPPFQSLFALLENSLSKRGLQRFRYLIKMSKLAYYQ